jgi:hypothetical protein
MSAATCPPAFQPHFLSSREESNLKENGIQGAMPPDFIPPRSTLPGEPTEGNQVPWLLDQAELSLIPGRRRNLAPVDEIFSLMFDTSEVKRGNGSTVRNHGTTSPAGGTPNNASKPRKNDGRNRFVSRREQNDSGNGSEEPDSDGFASGEEPQEPDDDDAVELEDFKWDTQCSWCDDGGSLLECEGPCLRSFHIGGVWDNETRVFQPVESPPDCCNHLKLPADLAQAIIRSSNPFLCPNCHTNKQVCYQCKQFGVANEQVFKCIAVSCGRFYHQQCVLGGKSSKGKIKKPDATQSPFLCGLHTCKKCGKSDNAAFGTRELIPCRRCPTAYHEECMPDDLFFAQPKRVWQPHLDANGRILAGESEVETALLYCFKHNVNDQAVADPPPEFTTHAMMAEWRRSLAELYPHLKSSKEMLKPPKGKQKRSRGTAGTHGAVGKRTKGMPTDSSLRGPSALLQGSESLGDAHDVDPFEAMREEERQKVTKYFDDARREIAKDTIRCKIRQPVPYNKALKRTVEPSVLGSWEVALGYAFDQFNRFGSINDSAVVSVLGTRALEKIARQYDEQAMALAPYLHGNRYSSYGRHFTRRNLLELVASRLAFFLRNDDCVVDFSCGTNEFVPLVKRAAVKQGIRVTGRAYDIIVARDCTDFVLKSWFDTRKDELPPGKQLVIGLNPPFGKDSKLAKKFVEHAAQFHPRIMVLIVPPGTEVPLNYHVLYEDRHSCRGEMFYVPGSSHASWNKEYPAFRILVRDKYLKETLSLRKWEPVRKDEMRSLA